MEKDTQLQDLADRLLSSDPIDTASPLFEKSIIPERIGVYAWSTKDGQVAYVGSGIGKKSSHTGLYRRIITELLNPHYLLSIEGAKKDLDSYQIKHCAYRKRTKKPAIDKNAFRKNVGRIEQISPGEPTVNFIKSNFLLRFVITDSDELANKLERKLIIEKKPKYNIQGNHKG